MKFDGFGLLIMEHDLPDMAGATGDSCAETGRYAVLGGLVDYKYFEYTQTPIGLLRHPLTPWREDDFGPDQWLPRHAAGLMMNVPKAQLPKPPFSLPNWALYLQNKTLVGLALYMQAIVFGIGFRWDDEHRAFKSSKGSTADYLNWFILMYAVYKLWGWRFPRVLAKVDRQVLTEAVISYYKPEWEHPYWTFLPFYMTAIEKIYGD